MPRDTVGSFEPYIVKKRQRRLTGVEGMVLSLLAKGFTHGAVSADLAEVSGAEVSKQTPDNAATAAHADLDGERGCGPRSRVMLEVQGRRRMLSVKVS